jgi:hypothetical protein
VNAAMAIEELRLRLLGAAITGCCDAGRTAYPDACPWHGDGHFDDWDRERRRRGARVDLDTAGAGQ